MIMVRHALLLCAAGALLGVGGNVLTPRPAPLGRPVAAAADAPGASCQIQGLQAAIPRISVEEAKPLCAACSALFVDARSAAEYEASHITGALHLAPGEAVDPVLWRLGVYKTVVVYDRDPNCSVADQVAKRLLEHGVQDVRVLTGAWPAWTAAGAPGTPGACAACGAAPAASSKGAP
ncbi:MAG TPA: rhodanese-like domain-containing protein [Anaeromyxobacteraceae bacterium]